MLPKRANISLDNVRNMLNLQVLYILESEINLEMVLMPLISNLITSKPKYLK